MELVIFFPFSAVFTEAIDQESFDMAYRLRLEAAELHYSRTFGYWIKKGVSEARSNRSTCNPL
jgi:hypothetical protein